MKPDKLDFFKLFEQFINDNKNGKRLQKNGKRVTIGTIKNYECVYRLLTEFTASTGFILHIHLINKLNKREYTSIQNYYKKFYKKFTDFLYNKKGHFDNYVGMVIKVIRLFFKYLTEDKNINTGDFYKKFYVRQEEIPVSALSPEQFNFIVYNNELNDQLSLYQKQIRNIFIIGCVTALRYSDLMMIRQGHLYSTEGNIYLKIHSKKTGTFTQIKLPDFAKDIINTYKNKGNYILPQIPLATFNNNLKKIAEKAGWTEEIIYYRTKQGKRKNIKKKPGKAVRLCDIISSHMMRRSAITNMISLGVPETVVRKISGHAPNSKEFYRYVKYAQGYLDEKTDLYYEKLKENSKI